AGLGPPASVPRSGRGTTRWVVREGEAQAARPWGRLRHSASAARPAASDSEARTERRTGPQSRRLGCAPHPSDHPGGRWRRSARAAELRSMAASDIAVIGGGLVGLSLAFELATLGTSVT